ncbi:amidase family protein [Salinivibrio sp. ES.052]|uniref:amidase family protein n=1 Tax=Salinivibrio sp. ES.052 TaxID=1882823 RepID=UPI000928EC0E|nr:amidase family protein [Salinivibrio sp. ES.052]SIN84259.1 Asp-tRNAAsn/Glu-tRNAGln amidotransferase A subunit [Salinivibrio sp. ES.052]
MLDQAMFAYRYDPPRQDSTNGVFRRHKLAVSHTISLEECVSGIGIPAWSEARSAASQDAAVVKTIMAQGASLLGQMQVDPLGFSITGFNPFYAELRNPNYRQYRVGGANAGVAVAVAKKLADMGLGNDAFGGVRIPAAHCGLFGYRPTPGLVDTNGFIAMTETFDNVGVCSASLGPLSQFQEMVARPSTAVTNIQGVVIAEPIFALFYSDEAMNHVYQHLEHLPLPQETTLAMNKLVLSRVEKAQVSIASQEFLLMYQSWLADTQIDLPTSTQAYLDRLKKVDYKDHYQAKKTRKQLRDTLCGMWPSDKVLIMPSTPGAILPRNVEHSVSESFNLSQRRLMALADVCGLPQLTVPLFTHKDTPYGITLLAHPNKDKLLMEVARRWLD